MDHAWIAQKASDQNALKITFDNHILDETDFNDVLKTLKKQADADE